MRSMLWIAWGLIRSVLTRKQRLLVTLALIQVIFAAAVMWGIPLIVGENADPYRFLTAAWHLGVLCVGLSVAPQVMAEWKADGYFNDLKQLPIPRVLLAAAELASWLIISLPGVLITPMLAWVGRGILPRHMLDAIVILLAASLIYIGIGLSLVVFLPLETVQVVSQILMVVGMLFSPILYPISRLPEWVETVHSFLPFASVNAALLNSVTGNTYSSSEIIRIIVWVVVATGISAGAMAKRQRAARLSRNTIEVKEGSV